MLWELLRNTGLTIFVVGGIVFFTLSMIHRGNPHVQYPGSLKIIADGMMLGGACLAVIAMLMDYLLSDTVTTALSPS